MSSLKGRVALTLAILGLTASVSVLALYPQRMERGAIKAARLPLRLVDWTGQDLPVDDYTKQILETDDVIQRNYLSPRWSGGPVQMAVVFSADNRRVAHPPEVCYRGSGWEVNDKRIVQAPGVEAPLVRLVLDEGGGRQDLVFYCYKSGTQLTANYYHQQLNIVKNQLLRRATSSALIRFSTPLTDTTERTEQKMLDLIRLMLPEIQKTLNE